MIVLARDCFDRRDKTGSEGNRPIGLGEAGGVWIMEERVVGEERMVESRRTPTWYISRLVSYRPILFEDVWLENRGLAGFSP